MTLFVVAMRCEARPIVARRRLTEEAGGPFPLYRSATDWLVISGIGRVPAAAATAWVGAVAAVAGTFQPWLNVGVAGHSSLARGTPVLASKIVERGSGRTWFPQRPFSLPCGSVSVVTVDEPETEYDGNCAFDMEASAFWPTANRFASAELVQCLKIVSDSPTAPLVDLDAALIGELVDARLDVVEDVAAELSDLSAGLVGATTSLEPFLGRWPLTVTQRRQLADLVRRAAALDGSRPSRSLEKLVEGCAEAGCRDGRAALAWIEEDLRRPLLL